MRIKPVTLALLAPHSNQWGFPGGSDGKESSWKAGDLSLIPGLGRSPGGQHDNPLQYSGLENPLDKGVWRAIVHRVTQSRTRLKWLSSSSRFVPNMTSSKFWECCFIFAVENVVSFNSYNFMYFRSKLFWQLTGVLPLGSESSSSMLLDNWQHLPEKPIKIYHLFNLFLPFSLTFCVLPSIFYFYYLEKIWIFSWPYLPFLLLILSIIFYISK